MDIKVGDTFHLRGYGTEYHATCYKVEGDMFSVHWTHLGRKHPSKSYPLSDTTGLDPLIIRIAKPDTKPPKYKGFVLERTRR